MDYVIQIGGAILILTAFMLTQVHRITMESYTYLLLNVAGAGILAVDALRRDQWGFVLLEGVWLLVTLWSLFRTWRSPRPPAAGIL
jgi:hypothetical protein